jgi:diadenosine tetraphosphate (Ap4A) HIT family hydrolase
VRVPIDCPFCTLTPSRIIDCNQAGLVIRDAYPVSPGHTLVIPVRHVGTFFATTEEERSGLLSLLDIAKQKLDAEFAPAGYNIGINDGAAAGQTVQHLHIQPWWLKVDDAGGTSTRHASPALHQQRHA